MNQPLSRHHALIESLLNGTIERAEHAELEQILMDSAQARRDYRELLEMEVDIRQLASRGHEIPLFASLPNALSDKSDSQDDSGDTNHTIDKSFASATKVWQSRFWLKAAAVLVVAGVGLTLLSLALSRSTDVQPIQPAFKSVARLKMTDSASWASYAPRDGEALTDGTLELTAGLAEIVFDSGASVILEGPAELRLVSSMNSHLSHGRLLANVPSRASGFTIDTSELKVIDQGTEFGMEVALDGHAEVHVLSGHVDALINSQVLALKSGQALQADLKEKSFKRIATDPQKFVRQVGMLVDLADIIGGGNGLGTGRVLAGINLANGKPLKNSFAGIFSGSADYNPVPDQPLIDGVFVPDASGSNQLDSDGHHYNFPSATLGVIDGIRHSRTRPGKQFTKPGRPKLDGIDYTEDGHTCIGMMTNAGVTFDLRAIAKAHGGRLPLRFVAVVGNSISWNRHMKANAFVFVDGEIYYIRRQFTSEQGGQVVQVVLPPDARFLTLVTTQADKGIQSDRVIWGDAKVVLGPK